MRKSQTEIMGLAIIFVIIIFGIMISLIFLRPKESSEPDIEDSTLASNMLNVILKTTLDCKDIELKNLLQDCAEGTQNREYCGANDNKPCEKVTKIINESLLQKTLGEWNKKYTFQAEVIGGSELITITNTPMLGTQPACNRDTARYENVIYEAYPVPLKNGRTMEISLVICRDG
jgi:hypothetical protein